MVSCNGLYADVADDSLRETVQANDDSFERKVIEGTVPFSFLDIYVFPSTGFRTLNKNLYDRNSFFWKDQHHEMFNDALQQIFPSSTFEREDQVKSLTEVYHKYKRKYVKHVFFNPDNTNLCE